MTRAEWRRKIRVSNVSRNEMENALSVPGEIVPLQGRKRLSNVRYDNMGMRTR